MKKLFLVILLIIICTSFVFADNSEIKKQLQDNLNNEIIIYLINSGDNTSIAGILIQVLNDTIILDSKFGKIYLQIESIAGFQVIKENKKK